MKQRDKVKQKDFKLDQQVLIKKETFSHEKRSLNKNRKDPSRSQKYFLTELTKSEII